MTQDIRIVLHATSHPGNIGAAARAMKVMGLTDLRLVAPALFPHPEAVARASGADDVLAAARRHATLPEALAGCTLVVGASARARNLAAPMLDPRRCAVRIRNLPAGDAAAIVFGPERIGLTNEELDLCHFQLNIPADAAYGSLNLAAAVQVVAYELLMAAQANSGAAAATPENPPATADEMEQFYLHLERVLRAAEFLDPANPKHLMRRLRRLYGRARPDRNEYNILRGMLTAVERKWGN